MLTASDELAHGTGQHLRRMNSVSRRLNGSMIGTVRDEAGQHFVTLPLLLLGEGGLFARSEETGRSCEVGRDLNKEKNGVLPHIPRGS